ALPVLGQRARVGGDAHDDDTMARSEPVFTSSDDAAISLGDESRGLAQSDIPVMGCEQTRAVLAFRLQLDKPPESLAQILIDTSQQNRCTLMGGTAVSLSERHSADGVGRSDTGEHSHPYAHVDRLVGL